MALDRRNIQRLSQKLTVQFPFHRDLRSAEVLNLSSGGMFLKGPLAFSMGQKLRFMFYVNDLNTWIQGEAVVRWSRKRLNRAHYPEGAGLEFIQISKENQFILRQFLQVTQALRLIEKIENHHARDRQHQAQQSKVKETAAATKSIAN